jgi:hypothetical protein
MVAWRGVTVCTCMPDMLDSLAASVGPLVVPMQGSYSSSVSASASTHSGGGAIDISIRNWSDSDAWALLVEARKRGLVASRRTPAQGFVLHVHGIVDGCPHLSGLGRPRVGTAAWQVQEYRAGRNGLAGRGRDDGPRDFVGSTWSTFKETVPTQPAKPTHPIEGDDMIVIGCLSQGDNSPDGISGKIVLCMPGFPEPKWLNGTEWGFVTRLFPYWASLPGSPFYWSEAAHINAMIQPAQHGATWDEVITILRAPEFSLNRPGLAATVTEAVAAVLRLPEFNPEVPGLDDKTAAELIDATVEAITERLATPPPAEQSRAAGLFEWEQRTEGGATTDMCPRLRGDAGKTRGTGILDDLAEMGEMESH